MTSGHPTNYTTLTDVTLDVLRDDKRAIFRAARLASAASDYLHALQGVEQADA